MNARMVCSCHLLQYSRFNTVSINTPKEIRTCIHVYKREREREGGEIIVNRGRGVSK